MQMPKRTISALASLTGILGLGLTAVALTDAAADQSRPARCAPAHRYIDAKSAKVTPHRVVVYGHHAKLVCGGPDDFGFDTGGSAVLRVLKSAKIKVWKMPGNPSDGMRKVAATDLPHWLKKNRSEPVYKIHGPSDAVTSLVEKWHP
ncbi:MAG TPA: hypothetical protein VG650_06455 [Mycobacteriales bacterium]|nr:hypothetical protein [Mycobacteriales bacterium]